MKSVFVKLRQIKCKKEVYWPKGVQVNQGKSICQSFGPIAHVKQLTLIFMDIYHQRGRFLVVKHFNCDGKSFNNASNSSDLRTRMYIDFQFCHLLPFH